MIHWQRSHAKDGASGYRLDWNGMCVVWTGDGRPSQLDDLQYADGCDLYITEMQPELVEISSGVQGVPTFLGRYTIDTHHTPGYAVGYLASKIQPRLLMTTHMPFDPYLNEEAVAEVRHHWDGPFHFGAPDGIVVNMTKDSIWVREGILPDYPNSRAPQFNLANGQLVVPHPRNSRADIQESFVREQELDPATYYPEGDVPELMSEWPVEGDLVVPVAALPETVRENMGAAWRQREANRQALRERAAASGGAGEEREGEEATEE